MMEQVYFIIDGKELILDKVLVEFDETRKPQNNADLFDLSLFCEFFFLHEIQNLSWKQQ